MLFTKLRNKSPIDSHAGRCHANELLQVLDSMSRMTIGQTTDKTTHHSLPRHLVHLLPYSRSLSNSSATPDLQLPPPKFIALSQNKKPTSWKDAEPVSSAIVDFYPVPAHSSSVYSVKNTSLPNQFRDFYPIARLCSVTSRSRSAWPCSQNFRYSLPRPPS